MILKTLCTLESCGYMPKVDTPFKRFSNLRVFTVDSVIYVKGKSQVAGIKIVSGLGVKRTDSLRV